MVDSIQPLLFGVSVFLVAEWLANKYADYVELSIIKEVNFGVAMGLVNHLSDSQRYIFNKNMARLDAKGEQFSYHYSSLTNKVTYGDSVQKAH
ncbi:hypothetical protein [Vibrio harveyi]|uniref:Uncharacterized protein n=1 Tax=Vibrio harveyi TaxID=669 RepID=A0A8B3DML1_VIBHA|nr:hypothetical protein [Vibrio harveyi]RIW17932.1 hypothetical protein DS957_003965 [Vibrio harveyi]